MLTNSSESLLVTRKSVFSLGKLELRMGIVQKDAFRTAVISYLGVLLGYINKGFLFIIILTQDQIGLVSLMITVGTLFAQIASFGTAFTTLKFFPFFKNHTTKHFGFFAFILRIVLAGALATTIGFILFKELITSWYIEKSAAFIYYYWWVLPIGIGYLAYLVLEAYLRSFFKNILAVFAYEIVLRVGVLVSLMIYAMNWVSFDVFVKINAILYIIPPIILFYQLWKMDELYLSMRSIAISSRFKKIMYKFSFYNYFNSLGASFVISLDVMMIAKMVGLQATGIYATVIFIASALLVPSRALIRVSGPLVAEYWKSKDMKSMEQLYKNTSAISLLIGLVGFLVVWLNIDLLFSFLKPEFHSGIWVFFAIMMGRLVDMYVGITSIIFNTSKKFKYDIYFTIVLVGLVYFLNLWFIPMWGIVGAAISTAFSLIFYNIGRMIFLQVSFKLNPFERNQFYVILLGVMTLLLGEYFGGMVDNLWVRAIIVTTLIGVLFALPIYFFKLESQSISYMKKGVKFISSKLKR